MPRFAPKHWQLISLKSRFMRYSFKRAQKWVKQTTVILIIVTDSRSKALEGLKASDFADDLEEGTDAPNFRLGPLSERRSWLMEAVQDL